MSNGNPKYERTEIQAAIEPVVLDKLAEMGIPANELDVDHARRTARSLIRMGAKLLQAKGCPPPVFMQICVECYLKELGVTSGDPEEIMAALAAKVTGAKPAAQA